eukprot:gene10909-12728_t
MKKINDLFFKLAELTLVIMLSAMVIMVFGNVVLRCAALSGAGSFKSQMKKADGSGASFAVIIGESEVANATANVKAMRGEEGEHQQAAVAFDEVVDYIVDHITGDEQEQLANFKAWWAKYGNLTRPGCAGSTASQSSRLVNSSATWGVPYSPGGRLMECSTTRSISAPSGRGPKLGERQAWAKRYQP